MPVCCQEGLNCNSVTERQFVSWLLREPQTLVWLPTLHRLTAAETGQWTGLAGEANSARTYLQCWSHFLQLWAIRYFCLVEIHNVRCGVCKDTRFRGLRLVYQCVYQCVVVRKCFTTYCMLAVNIF